MAVNLHRFVNRELLAASLAESIASGLEGALNLRDSALLAVSGGSTPLPLFHALARCELDWSRVRITQVDERWVDEDHDDSNARLVREHLLQDRAAAADFVSMKVPVADAFAAEDAVAEKLADFAQLDVAVLGMGEDGHTASFFPEADALARALDPHFQRTCLALRPPAASHDRMTLSLATLLKAHHIYLHITGEKKQQVLQEAMESEDVFRLPVRSLFHRAENPLEVFYAP
ncbi:MAG: 6-phosphogluconolactonase [Pseudomonadota bacterium]